MALLLFVEAFESVSCNLGAVFVVVVGMVSREGLECMIIGSGYYARSFTIKTGFNET